MRLPNDAYIAVSELFMDRDGCYDQETAAAWLDHTPAALLEYVLPAEYPQPLRGFLAAAAAASRASDGLWLDRIMNAIRGYYRVSIGGPDAPAILTTFMDLWARGLDWEIWEEFKRHVL